MFCFYSREAEYLTRTLTMTVMMYLMIGLRMKMKRIIGIVASHKVKSEMFVAFCTVGSLHRMWCSGLPVEGLMSYTV